jgi:hypothetical protein
MRRRAGSVCRRGVIIANCARGAKEKVHATSGLTMQDPLLPSPNARVGETNGAIRRTL